MNLQIELLLRKEISDILLSNPKDIPDDGLMNGALGVVYFLANIYLVENDENILSKVEEYLDHVIEKINTGESTLINKFSFMDGLSGLGYVANFLDKKRLSTDLNESLSIFDEYLFESCKLLINSGNYDFMNGSIGILYYFTSCNKQFYSNEIINLLYENLLERGSLFLYNDSQYINGLHIGYAHGIIGIAKVLDYHVNDQSTLILDYIFDTLQNIIKNEAPMLIEDCKYYLPRSIHEDSGYNWRPVLSWSNSDLNFASLTLSLTNYKVSDFALKNAKQIALESVNRIKESQTRIWDSRLFFGSSGAAQSYYSINKKLQNSELEKAYKYWINETFALYSLNNIEEHKYSFINNKLGTLLVFYEYLNKEISGWDKIILL